MYLERKEDLSLVYAMKDLFSSMTSVDVVDGFPATVLTLPTVAVDAGELEAENFELGNRRKDRRLRKWYIDVFAKSKTQRDDLGYAVVNAFTNGITIYDYDLGFPPTVVPSIEHMDVISVKYKPMRIDPELVEKLYYRATVTIVATNDTV